MKDNKNGSRIASDIYMFISLHVTLWAAVLSMSIYTIPMCFTVKKPSVKYAFLAFLFEN